MYVQVDEPRQDQLVPVVLHRDALPAVGKLPERTGHLSLLTDKIALGIKFQFAPVGGIYDIAFQSKGLHGLSPLCRVE